MLLNFLETLGLEFDMGWDDEVTITVPDVVLAGNLRQALEQFEKRLGDEVRHRARRQRSVFVGGSLNGQVIDDGRCVAPTRHLDGTTHHWIAHHLARGRWEVYDQEGYDGRAFFRGYATNKRKAKRGEISDKPALTERK